MSRSFRMQGGSAGSAAVTDAGSYVGFFQPGVNYIFASGKKNIRGRILPARDNSLSPEDQAFATSVISYRDMFSGEMDKETMTPAFTSWFAIIRAYRFFGKSEESFISPLTLRPFVQNAEDCADPVLDCYELARKSGIPEWMHLVEKPAADAQDRRSILNRPGALALFNMYCQEDGKPFDNTIMVVTKTALDNLKDKLSNPSVYGNEPVDPDFPRFLFGDITNPQTGLVVTSSQIASVDNKHIKYNGFVIGAKDKEISGVTRYPLPNPEAILAKRWDLLSDSTLKILTYQEIVDLLILDGAIPFDLIQQACGEMANISTRPAKNQVISNGNAVAGSSPAPVLTPAINYGPPDLDTPVAAPAPAPKPAPAPAPAPAPKPAPKAAVAARKFWVTRNGDSVLVDANQLQAWVDAGEGDLDTMAEDQAGGWQKASDFGIGKAEYFTQPATVPNVQESPAPSPSGAAADTGAAAPLAGGSTTAVSASSNASAEDLAEHAALLKRLESRTEPLSSAETQRLIALSKLIKG